MKIIRENRKENRPMRQQRAVGNYFTRIVLVVVLDE